MLLHLRRGLNCKKTALVTHNGLSLTTISFLNVDDEPTTTDQRWTKLKKRFETFLLAMHIEDITRKRALLKHYIGPSAFDIFETLSDTGDGKDYKTAMERLTKHFTPQRIILNMKSIYSVKLVNNCKKHWICLQHDYDNLPHLVNLRLLIKKNKSQIILTCSSSRLRRRALREPTITLKSLLNLGRAIELSAMQLKLTTLVRLNVHILNNGHLARLHLDIAAMLILNAYPNPKFLWKSSIEFFVSPDPKKVIAITNA